MLLQRVDNGPQRKGSNTGLKLALYSVSLIVAFLAGAHFERANSPSVPESKPDSQPIAEVTPAPQDIPKISAPEQVSATPAPSIEAAQTPIRIEKAIAMAPSPAAASTTTAAPAASTSSAAPVAAASPAKAANTVTMVEPVLNIPVKQGGKITGYINLLPGRQITPVAVENDQIKVKSGDDSFVYVPMKSTDMAH